MRKEAPLSIIFLLLAMSTHARSPHRPSTADTPEISIFWEHDQARKFHIRDCHLEEHPIFSIDHQSFDQYRLPPDTISYQQDNQTKFLDTTLINTLIEDLLIEIRQNQKVFSHFKIIKKKNFSFKKLCGLLILQFKDYPFVLKLFIETPRTFFDYYAKGLESICCFYMAGGANRHVNGLTRIKNRERLLQKAALFDQWRDTIEIPRKWFWAPKKQQWLILEGKNISGNAFRKTKIPGIYAIVADMVNTQQISQLPHKKQSQLVLQLSKDLDLFVDAHRDNFIFTNELVNRNPKIIILDTEHFPSMVGFKEPIEFNNYFEWFCQLIRKCFNDCYLHSRSSRLAAQQQDHKLFLWK